MMFWCLFAVFTSSLSTCVYGLKVDIHACMIEVKLELFSSIVKKFYYPSPIVVNVEQGPRPTDKLTKDQSNY